MRLSTPIRQKPPAARPSSAPASDVSRTVAPRDAEEPKAGFSFSGLAAKGATSPSTPVKPAPVSQPAPVLEPTLQAPAAEAPVQSDPEPASAPVLAAAQPANGLPAGAEAPVPVESRFNDAPAGMLDVCRRFGILVPEDRTGVIQQAKDCLSTVFKKIIHPTSDTFMIWPMVKSIASDIEEFTESSAAILNIIHRQRLKHDMLAWHSIYTALLAMGLAKGESRLPCCLNEIGGAALLHDAGFLFLKNAFSDIENEKNPSSTGHVAKGVKLAQMFEAGETVVKMIALHHARLDGKGFPPDLPRTEFGRCCQILSLANVAELMVCDLSLNQSENNKANGGASGLSAVLNEYRRAYDTDLLKKMISLIGFYPLGSMVELNNHVICKVIRQNNNYPLRPVVQVVIDSAGSHPDEEKIIDLKDVKILSIIRTLAAPEIRDIV